MDLVDGFLFDETGTFDRPRKSVCGWRRQGA
jgi:hypothetical protein